MSFLHSKLFLETVNLATDLPRFVQEHLSINPAAFRPWGVGALEGADAPIIA
jgi:hypothetical protein